MTFTCTKSVRNLAVCTMFFILALAVPAAESFAAETHSLRAAGASGDGRTDNTARVLRLLERIGGAPATIEISGGTYVLSSVTFPENVTLAFRDGGVLSVLPDHTVKVSGVIEAAPTRIFAGKGAVSGAVKSLHVFPQWFGARGDGAHDDARALQQAADLAASSLGRTLFIPGGEYRFDSDLVFRCNVECRGLLVKSIEIDEERTQFSNDLFLPTHHPRNNPNVRFEPDHPLVELAAAPFLGIQEGDMAVPVFRDLSLADGSGVIDLAPGGVLVFYSSDFFSSRNVRKGDHYYERNDVCQVVSGLGNVFPEFAFSYDAPPEAPAWDADRVYVKGDYCTHDGAVFKATYSSGPDTAYQHRHFGAVDIGPVQPQANRTGTEHAFEYEDGTRDSILAWLKVDTQVWYRPKDMPLTVNGLRMEVRLENHGGETKRIAAGAMTVSRSNMTFNNLELTVRDREATLSQLLSSSRCVNVEFNNGYFSGATSAHLGYNILNGNVANFRYNHCISTNSRKGMDGRHGKNITVNGGHYNVIDDHYGRNYIIRDVTLTGLSVFVPNDSTPQADLQGWVFGHRGAMNFNGANFHLENITVMGGRGGIVAARSDVGDLYGDIVMRDISIRGNEGDVQVFRHSISATFDYAHDMKSPNRLTVENVRLENPGRLHFAFGSGFGDRPYGAVQVRAVAPVGNVLTASPETHFNDCTFEDSSFQPAPQARFHFRNCVFTGKHQGLEETNIAVALGNIQTSDAEIKFPLEHLEQDSYRRETRRPRRATRPRSRR